MTREPHTPGPDSPPGKPGLGTRAARRLGGFARNSASSAARGASFVWRRRPRGARAAALLFTSGSAGLGAAGILLQAGLAARLPRPLDWAAAAALVERDARAGDAVLLSPPWAERARLVLPARVPVLAGAPDDDVLTGVRRVWLVSLPQSPGFSWAPELALLERAARSGFSAPLGGLEVTRFDVAAPILPLAFLPDRLAGAQVSLGDLPCPPEGAGFRCPGPAAVRVERTVREIDGLPRPCLLAAPDPAAGAPLVVTFPAIPVGRSLRGHAGVAGDAAAGLGAAVRIAVQVDGEEAGAAEISGGGWHAFQLDTSRLAGPARTVSLVLTSAETPGALCLDAVTLP